MKYATLLLGLVLSCAVPAKETIAVARSPLVSCSLAGVDIWENVTPPSVLSQLPGPSSCPYGTRHFAPDPFDAATILLGTCNMGIWKTTDCGTTWTHVDTGTGGSVLDNARQWTFAIDPTNDQMMYTNAGYGPGVHGGNGLWKSTDGGVNWVLSFPDTANNGVVTNNFAGFVNLDPADSTHLLLTMHAPCNVPYNHACWAESHDSGSTWTIRNGDPSWSGHDGQYMWILGDVQHLLYAAVSLGVWESQDGGSTWSQIPGLTLEEGHEGGQAAQDASGAWYLAGDKGIARSTDRSTWTLVANSGTILSGLTYDGATLYSSKGASTTFTQPYEPFRSSSDGIHWAAFTSPLMINGGTMSYDSSRAEMYSSNRSAGFWRVRLH